MTKEELDLKVKELESRMIARLQALEDEAVEREKETAKKYGRLYGQFKKLEYKLDRKEDKDYI